jgi:imidazolonepropionase-like amidohydrolase
MVWTVIKSKQLIVDAAQPPIPHGVVVLAGGRIRAAGRPDAVVVPPDSQVIDCSEETVLPGLIDAHTHITANNRYPGSVMDHYLVDLTTAVLRGAMNLRSDLASGVTTMRALGDRDDVERRFRDAIDRGEIPGPRLVISIRGLGPSHGTARFLASPADGIEELTRRIRENFGMGAQVIKLFVTNVQGGQSYEDYLRGDLTEVPAYSEPELRSAVAEAHRLGMTVAGHAIGGPGMRWAIEAGMDSVEHANLMEERDIELLLQHGVCVSDPNLQLFFDQETGFEGFETWRHDWWREKVLKARARTARVLPQAIRAGVKVCLGTDSTHASLWREAKHLVGIGVSTQQALLAVTKNSAELLGMEDETGTLEPGKRGDIISVRGDPLADIGALRHVHLVMKDGQSYEHLL